MIDRTLPKTEKKNETCECGHLRASHDPRSNFGRGCWGTLEDAAQHFGPRTLCPCHAYTPKKEDRK